MHRLLLLPLIAFCLLATPKSSVIAQTPAQIRLAETSMARGVAMAQRKQWPLAIKYFKAAFQATPSDPKVLFNLGLANDRAGGRALVAAAWYRAFLIAAPGANNSAKVNKRVVDLEIETESQIAQMLETAQVIASQVSGKGKSNVLDRIARAHAENGDTASARRVAQSIKGTVQHSVWAQALVITSQAKSGQIDLAASLANSIRFGPAKAWALAEISVLRAGKGDFTNALENASAITNGKERDWAHSRIAALQARAGDTEGARATLAKINETQLGLRLIVLTNLAAALGKSGQPWHVDRAKTHLNQITQEVNKVKKFGSKLNVYAQIVKARVALGDIENAQATQSLISSEPQRTAGLRAIAEGKKDFKGLEILRWSGLALQLSNSAQLGNLAQLLAQAKLQAPEKGALSIAKIAEKSARALRQFRQP